MPFYAADSKYNGTSVAVCQEFCGTAVSSQIYSKVIWQPQFIYISTASWWESLRGASIQLLFTHYGPPSSHYLVTQYEESYRRMQTSALPTLQPWHSDSLTWQPERSDWPISGESALPSPPTPPLTVHRSAYQRQPLSALCQRCFARSSCMLSSHLHAANHDKEILVSVQFQHHKRLKDNCGS
uniref:Uncharacterized protein n=1 Tax=Mastacembelus armatus TaxID=205130 RepID=A0A3Q3KQE5_9TELE